MMRRAALVSATVVASLTLLSACTGGNGSDTPSSSQQTPPSSAAALPFGGAPKVETPLPASTLAGDPCSDALTPQQVKAAIGIDVAGRRTDLPGIGTGCTWSDPPSGAKVAISYVTETHVGLSGVYQNTKPQTKTWKEMPPVQGFPAVAHDFTDGDCQISIGLADDLSIDVTTFLRRSKQGTVDPCEADAKVADLMITTLRQKAGA